MTALDEIFDAGGWMFPASSEKRATFAGTGWAHPTNEKGTPSWQPQDASPWREKADRFTSALANAWHGKENLIGLIPTSIGMFVLDVDIDDGFETVARVKDALGTPVAEVKTRKEYGRHLYYLKGDLTIRQGKWPGGDVRGDNDKGYVILWDAESVAGGLAEIDQHTAPSQEAVDSILGKVEQRPAARARQGVRAAERELREAPPGSHHDTLLKVTGRIITQGGNPEYLRAAWSEVSPGSEAEFDQAVEGAKAKFARSSTEPTDTYKLAQWAAERFRDTWAYVRPFDSWYRYDGRAWHRSENGENDILSALRAARFDDAVLIKAEIGETAATLWTADRITGGIRTSFFIDLANALERQPFDPPVTQVAALNCVVDTMTGEAQPHSPVFDTIGVAGANYLPDDSVQLRDHLIDHLALVFPTVTGVDQFIGRVGLMLSGRSPEFSGITVLQGMSGSGKGATLRLVRRMLGERAMTASEGSLSRKDGEKSPFIVKVIAEKPLFIGMDEIGDMSKDEKRTLLSLTGLDELSARELHSNVTRFGQFNGMVWMSSVKVPQLDSEGGYKRRIAVLPTDKAIHISPTERNEPSLCETCRDAVLTLGVGFSSTVGEKDWAEPVGDLRAKAEFMGQADPLAAWCASLESDTDGRILKDLLADARDELDWDKLTGRVLSNALRAVIAPNGVQVWATEGKSERQDGNKVKVTRVVRNRALPLPEAEPEVSPETGAASVLCDACGGKFPHFAALNQHKPECPARP